jgi:transposase-like protein
MRKKPSKGTYKPNTAMSAYEYLKEFPDAEAARLFLESKRWHEGAACPCCNSKNVLGLTRKRSRFYHCRDCRRQFSVRTGTIFENSNIPLDKWLFAFYFIVTARKGISSMQLSKEIGVTQKTAWLLESKIRFALGSGNYGYILKNEVQIDEAYFGGLVKNMHENKKPKLGSGPVGKTPVFGMRENKSGRVSAVVVKNVERETLLNAIENQVEKGAMIYSDEARQYLTLKNIGYGHEVVNHGDGKYVKWYSRKRGSAKKIIDLMATTNGIESVWALLKRGFYGTFHKFVKEYLQGYVNEFTFRLNEGNCKYPTMQRVDSLAKCCVGKRITYRQLVGSGKTFAEDGFPYLREGYEHYECIKENSQRITKKVLL